MSEIPVTDIPYYRIYIFTFRLPEVLGCSICEVAAIWDETPLCFFPPDQLTAHLLAHDIFLIVVFPCILISTKLFLPTNALFIKT